MTIERLGPVDPLAKFNKTEKTSKQVAKEEKDSIVLSEEAKSKAEIYHAAEEVRQSPDVREDRIAEIKAKLEDPTYMDDTIINSVADKIIDMFEL
jgi:negative regulator of flagellin synthesis FlgM